MRPRFAASVVLVIAATVLAMMVVTRSASDGPLPLAWYALLACSFAGVVAFALVDPYGCAWLVVCLSLGTALVAWMVSGVEPGSGTAHVALGIVSAVGLVAGGAYVWWAPRRKDPVPDLLRGKVPLARIFERNGVQFAYRAGAPLHHAVAMPVDLDLQNCIGEARTIELSLVEAQLLPGMPRIRSRLPGPITLGPCEVKRVRFPICAAPGAKDSARFVLKLKVTGPRGPRIRKWRANAQLTPPGLLQIVVCTLLFLPLGAFLIVVERGGIFLAIAPPRGPEPAPLDLPDPEVNTVWSQSWAP